MPIFPWIRLPLQGLWVVFVASSVWAAEPRWKTPADVAEALRDPDRFAWRLFIARLRCEISKSDLPPYVRPKVGRVPGDLTPV